MNEQMKITLIGIFAISASVIVCKSFFKARIENTRFKQQAKTTEVATKQESARHQILVNVLTDNNTQKPIRICGQCTHFNGNYQLPRCTRVQVLNLVDGRNKGTQCGPDGKLFNLKRSAA